MSEIKPALTAEEWFADNGPEWGLRNHPEEQRGDPYGWKAGESARIWTNLSGTIIYLSDNNGSQPEDHVVRVKGHGQRHALAALALHGQPFGFTHSGLSILREMVEHSGCNCGEKECFTEAEIREAQAELDRIADLLPPRDANT